MTGGSDMRINAGRARAALEMLFIGDALSMPVHWFYRPMDIRRAFPPGGIRAMEAAPSLHPSSIMSLHSTSGGGRSAQRGGSSPQIVGEVILKGRAECWDRKNVHYHQGLSAGENTLNTWCAHLLLSWLTDRVAAGEPGYAVVPWLNHYVEFMTADPARHPDTYAESYHRGFFANLVAGKPVESCGAVTHDTPSMGALVTVEPLALALIPTLPLEEVQAVCRQHVRSTHPDQMLLKVVDAYVLLVSQLLSCDDVDDSTLVNWFCDAALAVDGGNITHLLSRQASDRRSDPEERFMQYLSEDMTVVGGRYSLACYITDSWPGVCYLAARHFTDSRRALMINTNLGGENAHRGSVLGTLVGLASGHSVSDFYKSLARHSQIDRDIERWLNCFYN